MLGEILNPYYLQIISFILINIILGISIYITLSSGQLSLGNAGFMGIGAYTSALLTINFEVPLYLSIVLGAVVAGAFGILIGIPALRLSGVYLAIATLGFGEVLRVIFVNWDSVTKGSIGLSGIPHLGRELFQFLRDLGFDPDMLGLKNNQAIYLIVVLVLLIITIFIVWFFIRQNKSRVGRAYAAIKMDEKAAEAMGINITYYKVLSFTQGAILAGFAGALYAHVLAYISPADFAYHRAIDILIFSIFGGSEVIWGAIFGATFMTLLPEALRFISEYRYMIYGIILIVLMAFRPQGIIDVPVLNWLKRTFTFKRRDSNGIRVKKYN
ncbi:branched-chain amino acid ABC transporter permease [Psychrobacillus sp. FSL K6-4046]|uniref:branched-chain amino acid ABC transporter permease n=1 Tax=unclassified Psychrobacillus TaxID=2636677 RepID=UPI0020419C35|nr:branched-chain amino acid ABC transporter permease [Psychrobacillus sp. MER TA 171]MCM3359390.1 branched-chain amino acid ABC transporter permease [Psychrobacillus sp. MER TA 171]